MHISFGKNGGDTLVDKYIQNEATFGMNAGKVWQALSLLGEAGFVMLKDETELTLEEVHGALGWLAREGKIIQIDDGTALKFKLNE